MQPIISACVGLARETHSGALEWFNQPIIDLNDWIETINSLEKKHKKKK